jgi:NADH dehydrogenase [ubiquinone] 1 alpha subcomplex assembly factor 7
MNIFLDLSSQIRNEISESGPMSVYDFMKKSLQTAQFGYYSGKSNILGTKGDFITAPEISQLFGEIIGIWCLNMWQLNGSPSQFNLIELGPGKGTLMSDILRSTKNAPEFHKAINICLVEISHELCKLQKEKIKHSRIEWFDEYSNVPKEGFSILVANEFLDALPINQYSKRKGQWRANKVDITKDNQHLFINHFDATTSIKGYLSNKYPDAPEDAVIEIQDDANILTKEISQDIVKYGGAALFVDYGYLETNRKNYISTIQAIKGHRYSPIFNEIGNADISSHINFTSLHDVAKLHGANVYGPQTQGEFLKNMHIDIRKDMLLARASDNQKLDIESGYQRLIDPKQMGDLFKVIAISNSKFEHGELGF